MYAIAGGSIMAAALLPAWLTAASLRAEPCRIGPATFGAPTCVIRETSHQDGPAQYTEWREGPITYTVLVVTAHRRNLFRGYLARWLHHHKCTARKIPFGHEVHFEGSASGSGAPRQITWTGVCAAPGSYMVRAIGLKRQVIELHANRAAGDPAPIGPALAALLDRVRLSPASNE